MDRVYLDHNATTPLRAEARAAMADAMDRFGNPSSVHAEGRGAKGIVETARAQVASLVGCTRQQVIFTASATEAAALVVAQRHRHGNAFAALPTEHDCFTSWSKSALPSLHDRTGARPPYLVQALADALIDEPMVGGPAGSRKVALLAMSAANSETGIVAPIAGRMHLHGTQGGEVNCAIAADITQLAGKAPIEFGIDKPAYAILSAHKIGGPKGVGALINFTSDDPEPMLKGGGQEMGRRSGTENVIGIAGFGVAAEAAAQDVTQGRWERVAQLRNILEITLEANVPGLIFVGQGQHRLPNTSCFVAPGWKGETQVMQMDLAGFAISAGSACSSGKVKASTVLRAMGFGDEEASSAIRVSLGLESTEEEVLRFCEVWSAKWKQRMSRAA